MIPPSKKLLPVALASGLLFGLFLVFMLHGSGTTNTFGDLTIVLTSQLVSIAIVTTFTGWLLKGNVAILVAYRPLHYVTYTQSHD